MISALLGKKIVLRTSLSVRDCEERLREATIGWATELQNSSDEVFDIEHGYIGGGMRGSVGGGWISIQSDPGQWSPKLIAKLTVVDTGTRIMGRYGLVSLVVIVSMIITIAFSIFLVTENFDSSLFIVPILLIGWAAIVSAWVGRGEELPEWLSFVLDAREEIK